MHQNFCLTSFRYIVVALIIIIFVHVVHAQESKMLHVGVVSVQTLASTIYVAFLERMAELGYVR